MILGHIMSLGGVEVLMPPLGNAAAKQEPFLRIAEEPRLLIAEEPLLLTDEEPLLLTNEEPLLLTDEVTVGEKLSIGSSEMRWPLRRSVLFVVATSLALWLGIGFLVQTLF
jgi:hypothetical protein